MDLPSAHRSNVSCIAVLREHFHLPANEWHQFEVDHKHWVAEQTCTSEVIYCLPWQQLEASLTLFKLDDCQIEAERVFSRMCRLHNTVGFSHGRSIDFQWLLDYLPLPSRTEIEHMPGIDWTEETIDGVLSKGPVLESMFHRVRSMIGRLITTPGYLTERDKLKEMWRQLSPKERPPFPISPPIPLGDRSDIFEDGRLRLNPSASRASAQSSAFAAALKAFCERWEVRELATWDLPVTKAPQLPQMRLDGDRDASQVYLSIPARFPLQQSDGAGEVARHAHRRRSEALGINDHASWKTYETFLQLAHWTQVLHYRYDKRRQVRGFKGKCVPVLASLVEPAEERVAHLIKQMAKRRKGGELSHSQRR